MPPKLRGLHSNNRGGANIRMNLPSSDVQLDRGTAREPTPANGTQCPAILGRPVLVTCLASSENRET